MRYLIAMVTAVVFAAAAMFFISSPIASAVVRSMTFESPDAVANMHAAVFMLVNAAALVAGFIIGWGLGAKFKT